MSDVSQFVAEEGDGPGAGFLDLGEPRTRYKFNQFFNCPIGDSVFDLVKAQRT